VAGEVPPELTDGQISKLVGTTKPTIQSIRERTHWNISTSSRSTRSRWACASRASWTPPCRRPREEGGDGEVMSDDERRKLVSTEQSLGMEPEPKMPSAISGLETFSLTDGDDEDDARSAPPVDADSLFNLPNTDTDDDEDEDDR
jgi:hypothetical protein